jgi:c-di-GMP-binding flagellar brake protein YcgR
MSESVQASNPAAKPPSERAIPAAPDRTEQREHPRFKVDDAVAILAKGGLLASLGLGKVRNPVVNLSQGGVLVLAAKSIPVETRLRVRIEITKPADIVEAQASVRWCAQNARNHAQYYIGLRFEKPDPQMQKKIAQMHVWFTSAEFRTQAARKEASSTHLKAPRIP